MNALTLSFALFMTQYPSVAQVQQIIKKPGPDLGEFKPKSEISGKDSGSLFGRMSRKYESYLTDCHYILERTRTASFKRTDFCNNIPISFCFATIHCAGTTMMGTDRAVSRPGGKIVEHTCPSVNGKCPASAEECIKAEGFQLQVDGKAAIASEEEVTASKKGSVIK